MSPSVVNVSAKRSKGRSTSANGLAITTQLLALLISPSAFAESLDAGEYTADTEPLVPVDIAELGVWLEENDAVIGDVTINNQNIFDLSDPGENKWLYRLANRAHLTTRPAVIRSQLLFEPGAEYSQQRIAETERLLRRNRYIGEAKVSIDSVEDGVVDIGVTTEDVWTTKPDFSFGRKGGVNVGGFGIEEHNLLGTGTYVGANFRRTVDRDTASLEFADGNFRGSWYSLSGRFANNSDGFDRQLSLVKPFFSLSARSAQGFLLDSGERIDTLYSLGEPEAEFAHDSRYAEAFRGWSAGIKNGWARRLTAGLVFDEHRFASVSNSLLPGSVLPVDRRFFYPYVGVEMVEDVFETAKNFDQIERTEDRHLGSRLSARIGYSAANDVSTNGALIFRSDFRNAWKFADAETLIGGVGLSGRLEGGQSANTLLTAFAKYHRRQSERRLLFAHLTVSAGDNPDFDNPVVLGGASGLRGYPLRYQGGTGKALLTIEQRFFSDWYPFRLFRIGGAAFFDMGKTWGTDPTGGENLGLLRNVGLGLRIANTRSGVGRILHIDIAYPLDGDKDISGLQFLVEAKRGF